MMWHTVTVTVLGAACCQDNSPAGTAYKHECRRIILLPV
jgi:hypothetical protein